MFLVWIARYYDDARVRERIIIRFAYTAVISVLTLISQLFLNCNNGDVVHFSCHCNNDPQQRDNTIIILMYGPNRRIPLDQNS